MNPEGFFRRLLVPVDGSDSSRKASRFALRMASREHSEVYALHVIDEENAEDMARYADVPRDEVVARMRLSGENYLEDIKEQAREQGVRLRTEIRVGAPHREVLEVAGEIEADLVVMGTVGRRGPRRVLIGSVTERVIAHSAIPVLVVK